MAEADRHAIEPDVRMLTPRGAGRPPRYGQSWPWDLAFSVTPSTSRRPEMSCYRISG